jgi:acyl-CoA hydrolase
MTGTATLAESHAETTHLLLPADTNQLRRALGGSVLHWMDVTTAVSAMRFSNEQCVTAAVGGVSFEGAIELGEVAVVESFVYDAGRTSVDVRVTVDAEDTDADERRRAADAFVTYVAVDEEGSPTSVPDLVCPSDAEESRRDRARDTRRERLESELERLA